MNVYNLLIAESEFVSDTPQIWPLRQELVFVRLTSSFVMSH